MVTYVKTRPGRYINLDMCREIRVGVHLVTVVWSDGTSEAFSGEKPIAIIRSYVKGKELADVW